MVNKPLLHISDFATASYTFGCVKMSDFVPNNRHLRKVLIFFFHSKKTTVEAHRELQKVYGDAALISFKKCNFNHIFLNKTEKYTFYYKLRQTKFVDLIEANNFANLRFFRISHITVKILNFGFG